MRFLVALAFAGCAPGFYSKQLSDGAIVIRGHASVSNDGMTAARERLERLLQNAPKLRANLEAAQFEMRVIGLRQFASDLPEFRSQRGTKRESGELFDWHMIGGHVDGHICACSEATLLPIVGHRLFGDDTCMHELAHALAKLALGSALLMRIVDEYRHSMAAGRWKNEYAASNEQEWFAELSKFYFRSDETRTPFYQATTRGRNWLRATDPEGFAFVDALYRGLVDPGRPESGPLILGSPSDEPRLRSVESTLPVRLIIHNRSKSPIQLVWLDFDGHRETRARPTAPGEDLWQLTWATHSFVVTDESGHALCTIVASNRDGVADFWRACAP